MAVIGDGHTTRQLVLASASPRRREILAALGVPFLVYASDLAEAPLPAEGAATAARRLALAKALAVTGEVRERYIVGADTLVVYQGALLGKPADATEATAMLRRLRAARHEVVSGVAVVDRATGRQAVGELTTAVWMRDYGEDEIAAYVASGEPFDKAGAYAIQDPIFRPVARWQGCYLNVVGLPLCLLLYLLWEVGLAIPAPPPARLRPLCPGCIFTAT